MANAAKPGTLLGWHDETESLAPQGNHNWQVTTCRSAKREDA